MTMPPEMIQQAFALAVQHHQAGRMREAEQLYRQILAREPTHADALHRLGLIAYQAGHVDAAVDLIRKAAAANPSHAPAYSNLGNALRDKGQFDEAIVACRQAIVLRPDFAAAHYNLGKALQDRGQVDDAIGAYRQALICNPKLAEGHLSLGYMLNDRGEFDAAVAAYRQALALNPRYAEACCNLGVALQNKKQLNEAMAACRQALAMNANLADAHYNLAQLLLQQGDFVEGWKEYEWRWKLKSFPSLRRDFGQPEWDGSDLKGRTILVYAEQGFGDTMQFIRYVPLLADRGAKVVVGCYPQLRRLLEGTRGVAHWLMGGQAVPAFDVHASLMSLPLLCGTTLESIPAAVPYVHAEPERVAWWQRELAGDSKSFKVGLVWSGSAKHKNDRSRSLALADLAPLGQVPGVRFYSLQKGDAAGQAKDPPAGLAVLDRTEELQDFADTAALIANLDLVISVDTSVAHLAGALAKPVWTLLPFVSDWRWLLDRSDTPWYPTMRLFRQGAPGDWSGAIAQLAAALTARTHQA